MTKEKPTCKQAAELYFDGAYPLCEIEIKHLKKLANPQLRFINIHSLSEEKDKTAMLKTLHLKQDDRWITGLDANIAVWQYTRIGFIWKVFKWPIIAHIANKMYQLWSTRRYKKMYAHTRKQPAKKI